MWTGIVFCLLLVAVGAQENSTESQEVEPYRKPNCRGLHGPKNYPNPKQANTYFQCVYGRAELLYCPSRQLFNAARRRCLPLQNIDDYPDVDRSKIKCWFHGQYRCNPLNRHSFYQCSHGVPYLHDCPGGLVFNRYIKVCAWRGPGCGHQDCPKGEEYDQNAEKCIPTMSDPCASKELSNGYHADYDTSCEQYFRCTDGNIDGGKQKCPDKYRFDPRTLECEYDLSIVCAPCGTKQC